MECRRLFKWKYTQGSSFLVLYPSATESARCILAHFEVGDQRKPQCVGYYNTAAHPSTSLKTTVKQHQLRGLPTFVVLPETDCHYSCVPKPDMAAADIVDVLSPIMTTQQSQQTSDAVLMAACDVPRLLPDCVAQLHVFAAAEKKIAHYVQTTHAAGLVLESITVHVMALARFLATPTYSKLSLYVDRKSGSVPMAHLFYDGAFVAVRSLPNIVPESNATTLRDQCLLFAQACQAMIQPYENALHFQAGIYFSPQLAFMHDQSTKVGQIFSACCPYVKSEVIQATDWLPSCAQNLSLIHI